LLRRFARIYNDQLLGGCAGQGFDPSRKARDL